jgi:hypothetical protein
VLKKKKYLDDQPEPEPSPALEDDAPKAVEPEIPKSQPFTPQTVPQPPAQFKPQSLFGEKLKGALHKDS